MLHTQLQHINEPYQARPLRGRYLSWLSESIICVSEPAAWVHYSMSGRYAILHHRQQPVIQMACSVCCTAILHQPKATLVLTLTMMTAPPVADPPSGCCGTHQSPASSLQVDAHDAAISHKQKGAAKSHPCHRLWLQPSVHHPHQALGSTAWACPCPPPCNVCLVQQHTCRWKGHTLHFGQQS
jgi:hypothetical protein